MDEKTRAMMWEALGVRTDNDPTDDFAMKATQALEQTTGAMRPPNTGNAADFIRSMGIQFDATNPKFQALVKLTTEWRKKVATSSS